MLLDKAFEIAQHAHDGQVDKGGRPYIEHPLAVSKAVSSHDEKIVALLHDVVEDTKITLNDLRNAGFGAVIVAAISALTKTASEPYDDYLKRVKANPLARAVKTADIKHNMNLSRLGRKPNHSDMKRVEKYEMALSYLEE